MLSVPDNPSAVIALLRPSNEADMIAIVLEKTLFWWKMARICGTGDYRKPEDGDLYTQKSDHIAYVNVTTFPLTSETPDQILIWGETVSKAKTAYWEIENEKLKCDVTPSEHGAYFSLFIPYEKFEAMLPLTETFYLEPYDGNIVYYPFCLTY